MRASARIEPPASASPLLRPPRVQQCGEAGCPCRADERVEVRRSVVDADWVGMPGRGPSSSVQDPLNAVDAVVRSPGTPLSAEAREFMESRFGHDFGAVRVHTDERAADSAVSVNAQAYTVGSHLVFAPGQYTMSTLAGKELLAHELVHVIQQPGTPAGPPTEISAPSDPYERNAARTAREITQFPTAKHGLGEPEARFGHGLEGVRSYTDQRFRVARQARGEETKALVLVGGDIPVTGIACHCESAAEQDYDSETFRFIGSIAPMINDAAAKSGVPAHAIAGAIADEYDTQRGIRGVVDKLQDSLVSSLPEVAISIDRFFDFHNKVLNSMYHDIGPANIKVKTALELVQVGELEVPGSPINDIHVTKIIEYLLTEQGTVDASRAVIARARRLFGPYIGDYGEELQEAVLMEYFKQGDSYYERFKKKLETDPGHKICPGDDGCQFWHNHDKIRAVLEVPSANIPAKRANVPFGTEAAHPMRPEPQTPAGEPVMPGPIPGTETTPSAGRRGIDPATLAKPKLPSGRPETFTEKWQRYLAEGLRKLAPPTCRFPSGTWRYDARYWEKVDDPHYVAYKPHGIPPAEAIDRMFENLDKWDFDCAIYPEVAWLYAYRHALGDTDFNAKFKNLVLRQHETSGISEEFHDADKEDEKTFNQMWNDSPVGSKVMWTNRSPVTIGTDWNNENAIKSSKGVSWRDDRYDAHPLGANLLESEVKRGLARNANDFPSAEDERRTYVEKNVYRHQLHLLKIF
jgi:hypothetical protein